MYTESAYVTVIGAGVIGTSVCYYLAKSGVDVVLVERNGLADGTSGACGGYIGLQTKDTGGKLPLTRESRILYKSLEDELGEDIEYRERSGMIIAETETERIYIASLAERLWEEGIRIRLLDREELRKYQPGLPDTLVAATLSLDDCELNPIRLTIGFAMAAKKAGARIHTHSTVEGIQVKNGKVRAVVTDSRKILTEIVINAAGVWAPQIGRMVGLDIPITPRRGMLVVTEPVPPIVKGYIMSARSLVKKMSPFNKGEDSGKPDSVGGGIGIAQYQAGNIVSGTTREFVGYDKGTSMEGIAYISRELTRVFPFLKQTHVIRTFAGLRPFTPDGLPILGSTDRPEGFYIAAGHEGDGIALAPITGRLMAQSIVGRGGGYPEIPRAVTFSRFIQNRKSSNEEKLS
jgi:sarcosine oxidase subunit beta